MEKLGFVNLDGDFTLEQPENYQYLYFPIAGERGIKSAVTPNLGGDCKLDQNSFLLEPVSVENLHNNRGVRNFWVSVEGKGLWSAVGASAAQEAQRFTPAQEQSKITAGFMWQQVERNSERFGLKASVLSFVPRGWNTEIMAVTLENTKTDPMTLTCTAAIPLFGRSADNIRDHRHVTSLLHRIETTQYGVQVRPTLSFDERGHQKNERIYYVCAIGGNGERPESFYPTVECFIGEGGTLTHPRALIQTAPGVPAGQHIAGKEAMGGISFAKRILQPGENVSYTILIGAADDQKDIAAAADAFDTAEKVERAKQQVVDYWQKMVNVYYHTGNSKFDGLMRWISFQPILRRIYGCSFLPHHDYGRGGRGWRDLWQDCLSLLIMDPSDVRTMILDNFQGVRVDGTNATIIGSNPGEFVADRNGIARVWMDHGVWPLLTTKLYIDQTGDVDILLEQVPYFKDEQQGRGTGLDKKWEKSYGLRQKTADMQIYAGTVLEHILLQNMCAFYEVGAHNHIRLRGADWNDALDMAAKNGESVAFTCAYAGNLEDIADLLIQLSEKRGCTRIRLLKEMEELWKAPKAIYDNISKKNELLKAYLDRCGHVVSGETIAVDPLELAKHLQEMSRWIREHIRQTEWIQGQNEGWFNSYYDNHCNKVEGYFPGGVRMMLTAQVFAIMSKTATQQQTRQIANAADHYLYAPEMGGYRLNTDFREEKFDLGRMFGFAYGEKENGAVFSHMAVMYANALYQRGFVQEGYKALQTLADHALDFDSSKIYPGIPEYFNEQGRGLYHYLTGAASWYMLTMVTEVFGVKGSLGALTITPKLVKAQFDEDGWASIHLTFAEKNFFIRIYNPNKKDYGQYTVSRAEYVGGRMLEIENNRVIVPETILKQLPKEENEIIIRLD